MDRRDFVASMCWGGVATFAPPSVRFAHLPGSGRMVFVLLRGGFDGLHALVPIGDPEYQRLRGAMAYGSGDVTTLSDGFALAPGLASWQQLWKANELVAVHAMAIPYRTRSHFDGQAILETGLDHPDGSADGWLNRLLQVMEGERSGIAIASGEPRSLIGPYPVSTWSPAKLGVIDDAYIDRLSVLYRADRRLYDRFEAALQLQDATEGMEAAAPARGRDRIGSIFSATAQILREPGAPNVAAMEFSGWDTHANQGMAGGPLDRLLEQLAKGLLAFRSGMGTEWATTTVVVMTEFGRTARPNGTRGTDHGTAGAGFVIGPNVARSAVIADWPGLGKEALYEGRDLRPTLDTRSVLKGVVAGVFDLTTAQADRVFPGSDSVRGRYELIR